MIFFVRNPALNSDLLRNLAATQLKLGQWQSAADLLQQAARLEPNHVQTWFDLGRTLSAMGKDDQALEAFDRILEIQPEHAEAHNARGIMLSHLGRRNEAITCFTQAYNLKPDYPAPLSNLGNEYFSLADYPSALDHYDRALELNPAYPNAWLGRGNTLLLLERGEDALTSFDRALALLPGDLDALNGRGNSLALLKHYDEALQAYGHADAVAPNDPGTPNNRGNVYKLMGRHEEALLEYDRALSLGAVSDELMINKGIVLNKLGRSNLALAAFRAALAHNAHNARALTGCADTLRDLGYHDEAHDTLEKGLRLHPDNPELLSGTLFNLNYLNGITPADILAWHQRYGTLIEKPLVPSWQPHLNDRDPERRLRIGFVSGDLRRHPVGYFMESTFQALSLSAGLDLYAYANQPHDDDLTDRIRPFFQYWRDIWKQPDDNVAERIRTDAIDILVDLSGHTGYHRLPVFARKPAPIQVTYLGYFASTGLAAMDYILGNRWLMPAGDPAQFTEQPYRLPDTHLCYTPPTFDIPVAPLPALTNGYLTFGNFNTLAKLSDTTVADWSTLLRAIPRSRLLLKSLPLGRPEVCARVQERFAAHGIDPARLELEGHSNYEAYFATYHRVDIALDPYPYNGGTTTADALWMGVPVLCIAGDRYVSRMSASILHNVGLADWVAGNADDALTKAVRFSTDLTALATLRAGLRPRFLNSPLCDAPRFAANLDQAFRAMWRRWCSTAATLPR